VVAVDIFRERVFLKHEEHGPRIVPLLDLRDEVEQAQAQAPEGTTTAVAEPAPRASRPPGAPRRGRGGPPNGGVT